MGNERKVDPNHLGLRGNLDLLRGGHLQSSGDGPTRLVMPDRNKDKGGSSKDGKGKSGAAKGGAQSSGSSKSSGGGMGEVFAYGAAALVIGTLLLVGGAGAATSGGDKKPPQPQGDSNPSPANTSSVVVTGPASAPVVQIPQGVTSSDDRCKRVSVAYTHTDFFSGQTAEATRDFCTAFDGGTLVRQFMERNPGSRIIEGNIMTSPQPATTGTQAAPLSIPVQTDGSFTTQTQTNDAYSTGSTNGCSPFVYKEPIFGLEETIDPTNPDGNGDKWIIESKGLAHCYQ